VSSLETSVSGLGGCPFAPNSLGNVATEDVVNLISKIEGVETEGAIDVPGLLATGRWICEEVLDRKPESFLSKI
jgi:hypothetical protein